MISVSRINYRMVEDDDRRPGSSLLANCVVVLDDVFMLHDIRIMDGASGAYVVMPHRVAFGGGESKNKPSAVPYSQSKKPTGDVFHPVNKDFHLYLTQTIIDGFFMCKEEKKEEYFPSKLAS